MVIVSKSLITQRFTGNEFEKSSILNEGVTVEQVNQKIQEKVNRNKAKRMNAQKKY